MAQAALLWTNTLISFWRNPKNQLRGAVLATAKILKSTTCLWLSPKVYFQEAHFSIAALTSKQCLLKYPEVSLHFSTKEQLKAMPIRISYNAKWSYCHSKIPILCAINWVCILFSFHKVNRPLNVMGKALRQPSYFEILRLTQAQHSCLEAKERLPWVFVCSNNSLNMIGKKIIGLEIATSKDGLFFTLKSIQYF